MPRVPLTFFSYRHRFLPVSEWRFINCMAAPRKRN